MLVTARQRKHAFMAFACICWHSGAPDACQLLRKCGCVKPRITTRKLLTDKHPQAPDTHLFGDLAYPTPEIIRHLKEQGSQLIAPRKKPKGGGLTDAEKHYNRLVRKFRQPIEGLFNWINEKTGIQRASKVRSTDALMIHCWGKLAVAFFLLVFYY